MNEQDDLRLAPEGDAEPDLPLDHGGEPGPDLPLDPGPASDHDADPVPVWPWIAGLIIVAAVVAGLIYARRQPAPAASTTQPATPVQNAAPAPTPAPLPALGPAVDPVLLPALDNSDAAVRALLQVLSSRPELAAWLATDGLLRTVAACIENVAEGKSPARLLKPLAPRTPFSTRGGPDRFVTDAAAFARYDGLAAVVGGMDMQAVARLYATLRPRLDEAYQELGHEPGTVDEAVARGLTNLLTTPTARADEPLTLVVLSYHYTNEEFEALPGAQKQILRMGPRNAQTVITKLRELAAALGVPVEQATPTRPAADAKAP